MKKYFLFTFIASLMLLFSCGNNNAFHVNGTISGADGASLKLEYQNYGHWVVADSTKTDANGNFEIEHKAIGYPEIFRLTLGENSIYIPIDSIETITVNSDINKFNSEYTLTGSKLAEDLAAFDKKIKASAQNQKALGEVKAEIIKYILADPASINAYYFIKKNINSLPLFNISDKKERGVICAVATAYNNFKPNDPRTEALEKMAIDAQRKFRTNISSAPTDTLSATLINFPEIELPDKNGKARKLSEIATKGNVTVVNFSAYSLENSPGINLKLSELYKKYKAQGMEIYQIGLDNSLSIWKAAAENLPWITVYDEAGVNSRNLINYNIGAIPMTFVIDRKGVLQERVIELDKLDAAISKFI